MDILQPDAICMDETFAGIGYDDAPDRTGPLSPYAIRFFQDMRALIRSFGEDGDSILIVPVRDKKRQKKLRAALDKINRKFGDDRRRLAE